MEQWREDVLIHYGVKGMKWGNKKRMSNLEQVSRANESLYRHDQALRKQKGLNYTQDSGRSGRAFDNSDERLYNTWNKAMGNDNNGWNVSTERKIRDIKKRKQAVREHADNNYKTTDSSRKKYKQSQRRHKVKKLASKFGINIKQYR